MTNSGSICLPHDEFEMYRMVVSEGVVVVVDFNQYKLQVRSYILEDSSIHDTAQIKDNFIIHYLY
ncbi:predicted protein [Sclerotinia sclerotiorum 1980 UF-70]|uniref:Uncharacterized protein n=1 Tax=Sclerotinia sclerotiorum (strain ATCC 18683 / 1980 / Ss-1) TaxID=665079 RepID=A7F949_SCLS1|nr:predicted protein [Sclerotinia sclerotiorum 1980 UF-70]EDO00260.1 predicted protein [Sclerotinia sclerotiorum 1980 UF-70]